MSEPAKPESSVADDDARLAAFAAALGIGIEAALGPWVEASVARLADQWQPGLAAALAVEAADAGRAAAADIGPRVRALLASDVDRQRTSPLSIVREAVIYPAAVLRDAGVPPPERDEFAQRTFPNDLYDLAPATFADLDPDLTEVGLVWGAAKAHVILARRRAEGRR